MIAEADDRRFVLFTPMVGATVVVAPFGTWPTMRRGLMAGAMLAAFARLPMFTVLLLTRLTMLLTLPAVLARLLSLPHLVLRFGSIALVRTAATSGRAPMTTFAASAPAPRV